MLALAFGPYDLAAELGGESDADVMLPHRARMLVAARAAGRWAIDGPSREYGDPAIPARDALHARRLGYDGKLLIHPAQLAPVRAAFTPSADEVAYARRIVDAAAAIVAGRARRHDDRHPDPHRRTARAATLRHRPAVARTSCCVLCPSLPGWAQAAERDQRANGGMCSHRWRALA